MEVKEIIFENKKTGNYFFDLVDLEEIMKKNPKDHSQFDHHKISFFIIVFITHQSGKHCINYKDYTFKKGTVFTLRKNSIHKFYKNNAKGKFLVFNEDFVIRNKDKIESMKLFQLFNEMLGSPKLQLDSTEFKELDNILKHIENEYLSVNDKHSFEIIRNLIQVLIHKIFRMKSKSNDNLGFKKYHLQFISLQELVENECFENKKVSYYANKLGVTARTLNKITQSIINKSAKSFIDNVIILQIKSFIINSQLSFTEIAYKAGFDDPTNFFKYFRKKTGYSPKQFRESFK